MLANVHAKSEEMVALLHDRLPQTLQFGGNLFSSSIKKTGHSEIGFFSLFCFYLNIFLTIYHLEDDLNQCGKT